MIECPLRIPDSRFAGCCKWRDFRDGFADEFARLFSRPPSDSEWSTASSDWRAGNTGWEAARNIVARERDAQERAEHAAWRAMTEAK